ncbi:hypothetical protein EV426DRAFT_615583 [Tirmania nivea]|nr:hypothetical protein EV426DRAFT_615583 [Tirmania nivea]
MGLTPGALVFAIFCVLWTGTTGFVAGAVGWLYIRTRRQIDFISLVSYVVVLAMSASMAQQIYTIARWDYYKETQRQDSMLMAGKTKFFDVGSDKVVKAFYYTQILCYNICGTLFALWCFLLWANVQQLPCYWWISATYSLISKIFAVLTASFLMGISQIPYFSDKPLARFLVGNILLIVVLIVIPVFLVLILSRYIYYGWVTSQALQGDRRSWEIRQMNRLPREVRQGTSNCSSRAGTIKVAALELISFRGADSTLNPSARNIKPRKTFGTMLMLRFISAIIVMSGLDIFHICFQLFRVIGFGSGKVGTEIKEIPLTTMEQIADTYMFLPATAQGWLLLLAFGTTDGYWEKFKELLAGIFCFGDVCQKFRKPRQRHQCDPVLEQSTYNFIADPESNERGQPQSLEEREIELPEPARVSSSRTSRRLPLPIPQPTSYQPPSYSHKRTTSLMGSSKSLPPPTRNVHISRQLGAGSHSLSLPLEAWTCVHPATTPGESSEDHKISV